MLLAKVVLIFSIPLIFGQQMTTLVKRDGFLVRKKRYLLFPMNSNLVLTMSLTKPLMVAVPTGYATLLECDVPFLLPSDTRLFKRFKRNDVVEKREILDSLETALFENGLNGTGCVQRILCDVQTYLSDTSGSQSMIRDFLHAIFTWSSEIDLDAKYRHVCRPDSFESDYDCPIPFLKYILGSLLQM